MSSETHIVIVGGGIIGCTTAYYLTHHSSLRPKVTLIEASVHGPAQGASGKAGGLVAKWAYPKELVKISFPEHERLANEHNGKDRWGWRYVECGSWEGRSTTSSFSPSQPKDIKNLEKKLGLPGDDAPSPREKPRAKHLPEDLNWVHEELTDGYAPMAKEKETAQVHPYLFTTSMFELAKEKGLRYIHGSATKVLSSSGTVTGVEYRDSSTSETTVVDATHVLIAAGAWSPRVVPQLPIESTRAHSVTFRPREGVDIAPYVLFTEIKIDGRPTVSPEIYARPGNEVYACGPGDDCTLPETVDEVACEAEACQSIVEHVIGISSALRESKVEARQACFLPVVGTGGGPIVGEADGIAKKLYIATGHTCWVS